jgi:predicted  nucleic acid-binding Zn-ribbon protein
MTSKCRRWSWLLLFVVGTVALAGACDKSDQTRSALETHRTEWSRQIAALKSRTSDLEQRFKGLPPQSGATAIADQAQRRRLQASIIGTRQTLADMESHLAESAREIETAIRQGQTEGEEALNGVIARMNEYVGQQEQTLALNEDALTRTGGGVQR